MPRSLSVPSASGGKYQPLSSSERLCFYRRIYHQLDHQILELQDGSNVQEKELNLIQSEITCLEELIMIFADSVNTDNQSSAHQQASASQMSSNQSNEPSENSKTKMTDVDFTLILEILMLSSNSPWTIYVAEHTKWRLQYVSPSVRRMLGWMPSELVGMPAWQNCHPSDISELQQMMQSKDRGKFGPGVSVSYRKARKDCSYTMVQATGRSVGNRWYVWIELDISRTTPKTFGDAGTISDNRLQRHREKPVGKILPKENLDVENTVKLHESSSEKEKRSGLHEPLASPKSGSGASHDPSFRSVQQHKLVTESAPQISLAHTESAQNSPQSRWRSPSPPDASKVSPLDKSSNMFHPKMGKFLESEMLTEMDDGVLSKKIPHNSEADLADPMRKNHANKSKAEVIQNWSVENLSIGILAGNSDTIIEKNIKIKPKPCQEDAGSTGPSLTPSRPKISSSGFQPRSQPLNSKCEEIDLFNGKRVMVVEDDIVNRTIAQRLLQSMGCKVTVCCNGQQALDVLQKYSDDNLDEIKQANPIYDLVLMDLSMPVMGGTNAVQWIRDWEAMQEPPMKPVLIFAVTSNVTDGDMVKCALSGFDEFVSKPLTSEKLIEHFLKHAPKKADNNQ